MFKNGRYIAVPYNPNLGGYAERLWDNYSSLLQSNEIYSKIEISYLFDKMAEDESVDAALTFRNVHNWINDGAKMQRSFLNKLIMFYALVIFWCC